ncbi:hypothetical protein [Paracoccus aminovorans]|uniref:hypothetical protein n=1 Tax=Paracoccus aminovorans TaxID=34004 RepID=UPI000781C2B4|nr:hypothetical protein [Paracoccus aminovorans]MDQ7775998.1 hypothetical protein [Paracoccus aminovorans]
MNSTLTGLTGVRTDQSTAQNSPQNQAPAPQGSTPITDVSQDRIDLNVPEKAADAAPPVAAYPPPPPPAAIPDVPAAMAEAEPAPATATVVLNAEQPAPGTNAAADTKAQLDTASQAADASAIAAGSTAQIAPASTGRSGTSAGSASAEAAQAADSGLVTQAADAWSDEDHARAMAIKALQQERMLNLASTLTEAAEKHATVQAEKRAETAAATAEASTRPALLVA